MVLPWETSTNPEVAQDEKTHGTKRDKVDSFGAGLVYCRDKKLRKRGLIMVSAYSMRSFMLCSFGIDSINDNVHGFSLGDKDKSADSSA